MLTQSKLNNTIQRCMILSDVKDLELSSEILVDIKEFFNRLKSIEKIIQIPCPKEVDIDTGNGSIFFEWHKVVEPTYLDLLRIEFNGHSSVNLVANYESLDIDITQTLPIDEDFPQLILTHLKQFKTPIKKKRYK